MPYCFEDWVLDVDKRELRRGADTVSIAPQAFDLLEYLIRNRDRVVSKDDLINAIWKGRIVSDAALTTRLNVARKAIGDDGEAQRLIKTLPRKGFRFMGSVQERQAGAATEKLREARTPELTLPDKASIAVLPFTNLSSDPTQEYFADGIVGDVITQLSRFSELFVVARNSSFQYKGKATDIRQIGRDLGVCYVLEGSVQRSGDRIRISAQLIDAATGTHRWAEYYDRKLEEVFAVQDDVVRTIVTILAAHLRQAETERSRVRPPNSWQAYDYYLQAVEAFAAFSSSLNIADIKEARSLLDQSLAIDPNYARSYASLAQTYVMAWHNPQDEDFLNASLLERGHELARKAVQLDRKLPQAHAALGYVLFSKHQHDASIAAFEKAVSLNPNYVDWRFGIALIRAGDANRAIEAIHSYMRLDPFYVPLASQVLGFAHYMLQQYPQALSLLRDYVTQVPAWLAGHILLAATLARIGNLEEARAEVAETLRVRPDFTISGVGRRLTAFKCAGDDRHFFGGLRQAGLPD